MHLVLTGIFYWRTNASMFAFADLNGAQKQKTAYSNVKFNGQKAKQQRQQKKDLECLQQIACTSIQ